MSNTGKKVVSFSLWGNSEVYLQGALKAVTQVQTRYPDWESWFFLGADVPIQTRKALVSRGAVLREGPDWGPWSGMYWRFLATEELDVSIMLSRDVDADILEREVAAVDEWLESGKSIHIMRDHPKHEMPIMGGMWGCRAGLLRDIRNLIQKHGKFDRYGRDQEFLANFIYPQFVNDLFIHSECIYFPRELVRKNPIARSEFEFVGMAQRDTDLVDLQKFYMKEWIYAGSPHLKRPHPWSLGGIMRKLTRGRWPGQNLPCK